MPIEKIVVTDWGQGAMRHAAVVKAGRWVFATGLRALDESGLIDNGVLKAGRPLDTPPKAEREARFIFDRLRRGLADAGSSLANVVRVDQYYPDWRSVDPYHVARREALGKVVAPSTSVLVDGLLNPEAAMDVQVMAFTDESGLVIAPVSPEGLAAPGSSGYAPCTKVGDLVFVAGQLARDDSGSIAAEAKVPSDQFWKGTRIKLETEYLIEKRLRTALEAGGSSLDLILKAQVYLSNPEDLPGFLQVWERSFSGTVPLTTVVPVRHPAFGTKDATIEVNVVAAAADAAERIVDIECDVELISGNIIPARRLDDLVFVSGLMPIDKNGLVADAQMDPRAPYYRDSARVQMLDVLEKATRILGAAGCSLSDVVRAIHFSTGLADFPAIHDQWARTSGEDALPLTAVQVNDQMFVPGACVILDLWASHPKN